MKMYLLWNISKSSNFSKSLLLVVRRWLIDLAFEQCQIGSYCAMPWCLLGLFKWELLQSVISCTMRILLKFRQSVEKTAWLSCVTSEGCICMPGILHTMNVLWLWTGLSLHVKMSEHWWEISRPYSGKLFWPQQTRVRTLYKTTLSCHQQRQTCVRCFFFIPRNSSHHSIYFWKNITSIVTCPQPFLSEG